VREVIDLSLLCAQSREMLIPALGSGLQLKIEVTSAPCRVLAARVELEQFLVSLVLSAWRAMPVVGRRSASGTEASTCSREIVRAHHGQRRFRRAGHRRSAVRRPG